MSSKLSVGAAVVLSALAACANPPPVRLVPGAEAVVVMNETPVGCQLVGDVGGRGSSEDPGYALHVARIRLRNYAIKYQVTHVTLQHSNTTKDQYNAEFVALVVGQGYRCAPTPAAPQQQPAATPAEPAPATLPPAPPPGTLPPVG